MNMIGLHIYQIAKKIYNYEIDRKERVTKLKERMNRLCERRNSIAHQFDMFHENAEKKPIHINTVREFIENAKEIVDVVNELMLEHDIVKR